MQKSKKTYLKSSEAAKHFGVCQNTIRQWDKQGFIKVIRVNGLPNGHRRYDISSFSGIAEKTHQSTNSSVNINNDKQLQSTKSLGAIYCRVSSGHQKDDLQRQINSLSSIYPKYAIFKDIASGINFKRQGFLKIIKGVIDRDIKEIVVAHKDRFTRFAFDLVEWIFEQYGAAITVLDKSTFKTPEQELADDLLSIVHVFSCRQNGRRKYLPAKNVSNSNSGVDSNSEIDSENNEPTIGKRNITTNFVSKKNTKVSKKKKNM